MYPFFGHIDHASIACFCITNFLKIFGIIFSKSKKHEGMNQCYHQENVSKRRNTGLKGFEPLTCGLRVRRYAELSYRPKPVRPNNVVDIAE